MSYDKKPKWPKYCTPLCTYLKCSKKAIGKVVRRGSKEFVECNFVPGDFCTGQNCNYSYCAKRSFRSDGKCGQWVSEEKRRRGYSEEEEDEEEEIIEEKESVNVKKISKKFPHLKNKISKKLKYDDYDY